MHCIRRSERRECHFSKFTQFQRAIEYILTAFKECYHATRNQTYCYAKLDMIHLKDCAARFYLYYVGLHHIHFDYWHENLQTQLTKVRVCLQHALNDCSSRVVNYIVKIFASIIMIDIPDIRNAFDTRLIWGNNTVWCRTTPKIEWVTVPDYEYEDYVPLPHTKMVDYHVEYEHMNQEHIDWERHVVPRQRFRFTLAPWPTVKYYQEPYSNVYQQVIPIAPTRAIAVVPPVQEVWDYRPLTTAKLYVKQPQVHAMQHEVEVVTQKMEYHPSYETGPWIKVNTEVLSIKDIIIQSGGCQPKSLECRTVATQQNYLDVGQVVVCDIIKGFICHDKDQRFVCNSAIKDRCSCYKYEVRIICFDRVEQASFRPTTVETALVMPEIRKVPKVEVFLLPFTKKVYYPPEPHIFEEWIPQTTFQDFKIPIERRIIHHVFPSQPTRVYKYTVAYEMYHDKVFKVAPKIVRYPIVPKRIEKYFSQTTQMMRFMPKLPRIYVDKQRGFITTRKYHWTRSSQGYVERKRNFYAQIVPRTIVHDYWLHLPPTKVMNYPPRCNYYGEWICIDTEYVPIDEIVKRSGGCSSLDGLECRTAMTHEDHKVVGQAVICDIHNGFICRHSDQRNVCNATITNTCGCYSYEVRIRCCTFHVKWTVAPVVNEYFPAKVRLDHKTMLPPKVVMELYPVQPRIYTQKLTPTKSILIHIFRPEINIVQRATQTTAKLFVKQPKAHYLEHEVGVPVTRIYKVTPAPNIYHVHQDWIVTPKTVHVPKRRK
ncbi:hypothetical protein HNY73_014186 [Argiope bruennichi]|uniref:WxxW domain-containing protein n=1 Tax=Argiope bruennichi TaxID=94029 RepID=A0A8T0ETG9_ARGBR|nr:hypothetical protein HNY73_014186 [Argiope bruennichi]